MKKSVSKLPGCCTPVLHGKLKKAEAEQLAQSFKAIADPARLQLLSFIAAVGQFIRETFHVLITVCDSAKEKCPVFPGVLKRIHWPLEDPAAAMGDDSQKLAVFRRVRDEIEARVRDWVAEESVAG